MLTDILKIIFLPTFLFFLLFIIVISKCDLRDSNGESIIGLICLNICATICCSKRRSVEFIVHERV